MWHLSFRVEVSVRCLYLLKEVKLQCLQINCLQYEEPYTDLADS